LWRCSEKANAANSPDPFDLQGTPEDTLFAAAVRSAITFVVNSEAVRYSEFQTVKVGTGDEIEYRPRINLLESISTIYAAYTKAYGLAALSESTFRRRCILPEMKPESSRLCSAGCEAYRRYARRRRQWRGGACAPPVRRGVASGRIQVAAPSEPYQPARSPRVWSGEAQPGPLSRTSEFAASASRLFVAPCSEQAMHFSRCAAGA
jgi:hypothetical protein